MTDDILHMRDDGPVSRLLRAHLPQVGHMTALAGTVVVVVAAGAAAVAGLERSAVLLIGVAALGAVVLPSADEDAPLRFLDPGVVRAVEVTALLVAAVTGGVDPATVYGLLLCLAYHHYEALYRRRTAGAWPSRWRRTLLLGWETRLLLIVALVLLGVGNGGVTAATVLWSTVCAAESVHFWRRGRRPGGLS